MKRLAISSLPWWLLPLVILLFGGTISGVIIARNSGQGSGVQATLRECVGEEAAKFACYRERLDTLVAHESVEAAFDDLKSYYEKSRYVQAQCHQLTHVIGKAGAKRYPDVAEAYKYGDSFCWSGYHHGVMQEIAAQLGYENIKNQANTICASLSSSPDTRYGFDHYNCVHGLGHGFMGVQSNELFTALSTCDALHDYWERESCYGGVFMENVMAYQSEDTQTKYLNNTEPMYPCAEVENKYKTQCYLMQTSHALVVVNQDYSRVFELCREVQAPYDAICYQSLGRDASGSTVSDPVLTKQKCMLGQTAHAQENCIIGAVKDFISYFRSDAEGLALCGSLDTEQLRQACTITAKDYYESL